MASESSNPSEVEALADAPTTEVGAAGGTLPEEGRGRFYGELGAEEIVAWAPFDLDENNRYAKRYAVLTEDRLLIVGDGAPQVIAVGEIEEAAIVEGLGVDSLNIIAGGKRVAEIRYTRHTR